MLLRAILVFGAVFLAPAFAADETGAPARTLDEGLTNPGYHEQPEWFKQSFLDIREDIDEAAADGRRLMLYFYQDGCPYCKKLLEQNFGQRDIAEKTRSQLDVVAINLWGDREVTGLEGEPTTEKQFAADLEVMFTPTLVFLDETGKVLMRLNGYYPPHKFGAVVDHVGQAMEKKISFRDYWSSLSPPAEMGILHGDPSYLQPPFRLDARSGDKPLLVLFEQKDCAACDELHLDIFKREESRELLEQFDVVLLDMWSSSTSLRTPDGTDSTAAEWSQQLGIQYAPTLVLFDSSGREAFRTEAYLKAFHIQSALDYVLSGAWREQPSFQRFIAARADRLEAQGQHLDIME